MRTRVEFYPESAHPSMWGQALTLWGEVGAAFDAGFVLTSMGSNVVLESPWYATQDGPLMLDSMLVQDGDTVLFDLVMEASHPANGRPFARFRIRKGSAPFGVGLQVAAEEGVVHCWNTTHLSNGVGTWGQEFMSTSDGWLAGDPHYGVQSPACSETAIAVAAYYSEYLNPLGNEGGGTLANFSTYGPTLDGRLKPEIAAPGVSVESSISSFTDASFNLTEEVEFNGINYPFAKLSGTSMSGPAVAGIVALMLEANPELSVVEVREALKLTAREDDHTGEIPTEGSTVWGWGKVNAVRAVQEVLGINGVEGAPVDATSARFSIWPNPVGTVLHLQPLEVGKAFRWTVFDALGKVCESGKGHGHAALNTAAWPAGAVLLQLVTEDGQESHPQAHCAIGFHGRSCGLVTPRSHEEHQIFARRGFRGAQFRRPGHRWVGHGPRRGLGLVCGVGQGALDATGLGVWCGLDPCDAGVYRFHDRRLGATGPRA